MALGVLTVVMGKYQQLQSYQHLSQLIIAAAVLPGSMGHKDEGPAGMKGELGWERSRSPRLQLKQSRVFMTSVKD